ncbi:DUF4148 domain-containing protein [Burkholderia ubonensis]|uniref:DUF4148 domain-containing protein n=1 Tax=Burkholderia ubonensis TaxID=101571 RepID=UPI001E5989D7|nr:DUF4148 domain-containing protein [Burkholderia ubonensis]
MCSRTRPGAGGKRTAVAAISATAVGSMPAAGTQAGSPAGLPRAQVKQELLRAQKSGELERLNQLYEGGQ